MAAATPIQSFETPEHPRAQRRVRSRKLFEPELVREALKQSFIMLRPDIQWSNPVMFVVEIGAVLTLLFIIQAMVSTSASQVPITYFIALDFWLWLTVLFANFATGLAEARGKAQAESLRRARSDTPAYRLRGKDIIEEVPSSALRPGDRVVIEAGQRIPRRIKVRCAPRSSRWFKRTQTLRSVGSSVRSLSTCSRSTSPYETSTDSLNKPRRADLECRQALEVRYRWLSVRKPLAPEGGSALFQ